MSRNSKTDNTGRPIEGAEVRPIEVPIGRGIHLSILPRRAAPEQQHRFEAAVDALLSEIVRREISRKGNGNEPKGT